MEPEIQPQIVGQTGQSLAERISLADRTWRLQWAAYFEHRARKSRLNGQNHPEHQKLWYDKAIVEEECAIVLRMLDKSLPELNADLDVEGRS